jgi:disulfide bond formation protein DsbB
MSIRFATRLNALALYAIAAALLAAFYYQVVLGELPCPLCLLQRVGFVALALGPVLTLRYGPRPAYYGLVIIAALIGAGIAGRQVLLHIAPGDPGFGSALFGYHFYTWAFVCFATAIAASAAMLLGEAQFAAEPTAPEPGWFETAAVWLVIAVTALNAVSVLLECGFGWCPANPVHYELIQGMSGGSGASAS